MASKKATKRQFPKTLYIDWANGEANESDFLNPHEKIEDLEDARNGITLEMEDVAVYELKYVATIERKTVLTPKK